MRLFLLFVVSAWILLSSPITFAYPNEQDRFIDFSWGTSLNEVKTVYNNGLFIDDDNITTYLIPMRPLDIEGIKTLPNIALYFYNDKLFETFLVFDDKTLEDSEKKYQKLLEVLSNKYGEPSFLHDFYSLKIRMAVWKGENTSMILYHNDKQSEFLGDKIYTNILVTQDATLSKEALSLKSESLQ